MIEILVKSPPGGSRSFTGTNTRSYDDGMFAKVAKKNSHGMKEGDFLRTNSGGSYSRVANAPSIQSLE